MRTYNNTKRINETWSRSWATLVMHHVIIDADYCVRQNADSRDPFYKHGQVMTCLE